MLHARVKWCRSLEMSSSQMSARCSLSATDESHFHRRTLLENWNTITSILPKFMYGQEFQREELPTLWCFKEWLQPGMEISLQPPLFHFFTTKTYLDGYRLYQDIDPKHTSRYIQPFFFCLQQYHLVKEPCWMSGFELYWESMGDLWRTSYGKSTSHGIWASSRKG